MTGRSILALGGASLALAVAPAVASAATVTARIEGASKTLQKAKTVSTPSGSITKFGAPAGACPGSSAQGALQAATGGRWKGSYSKTYSEYFVSSILGETPNSKTGYWGIWVNHKYATTGACQIALKARDDVLFAVDSVKKHEHPLGITAPQKATAGKAFTVKVVQYSDSGKASPVVGAHLKAKAGINVTTGKGGKAAVLVSKARKLTLTATDAGTIRDSASITISS
jgi:hypothetical protein